MFPVSETPHQDRVTLTGLTREGWFTWCLHFEQGPYCAGTIVGSPGYLIRRLLMWMTPLKQERVDV
jgi:hypothetical protein